MESGYCPACGEEVPAGSLFCHKCGHRIDDAAAESGGRTFNPDSTGDEDPPTGRPSLSPRGDREDHEEVELWSGGYSFKAMMPAVIGLGGLAAIATVATAILAPPPSFLIPLVGFVLLMLFLGLRYFYMRLKVKYRLTSQRFEHELGVLRRVTDRVEVIDVDDVTVEQGLIDRFFKVGKIHLTSSDRTHPEIVLVGIEEVRTVADMIDKARRKERVRRGLHIEAV